MIDICQTKTSNVSQVAINTPKNPYKPNHYESDDSESNNEQNINSENKIKILSNKNQTKNSKLSILSKNNKITSKNKSEKPTEITLSTSKNIPKLNISQMDFSFFPEEQNNPSNPKAQTTDLN
jgi:hypothetical protein